MRRGAIVGAVMFTVLINSIGISRAQDQALQEMTKAAENLINSLSEDLQEQVIFELTDQERVNWHYVPREREGISFKEMSGDQKLLAHGLISAAMSNRGAWKAVTIMFLDQILRELEGNDWRDYEAYWITFFGRPSLESDWGWRIEGHHLSVNFTIVNGEVVSTTPLFMGANPARVQRGAQEGLQVLSAEENLGRKLVKMLDEEQRKKAVVSKDAPSEILTRNEVKVSPLEPKGLPVADMTDEQKQVLRQLVEEYVYRVRPEFAQTDVDTIQEAGYDKIHFAWAGSMNEGEGHYYRIQGPTFLLEYDNTQNNANHVHTVWRNFDGDFGMDVLAEHYRKDHTGK